MFNVKLDFEGIEMVFFLLNVIKEEVIMIGDNYYDIEVGKNVEILIVGVVWVIKGLEYLV